MTTMQPKVILGVVTNSAPSVGETTQKKAPNANPDLEENQKMKQDWKAEQAELDIMFDTQAREKLATVKKIGVPTQLGDIELFDYQKDGISWMVHQEKSDAVPPFWKLSASRGKWYCTIPSKHQDKAPDPIRGGILADEMGLGKTIQTLGLICANQPSSKESPRCTLIVAPVSVMAAWAEQIDRFINTDEKVVVKVAMYHGANRAKMLSKVQRNKLDILIVSYNTLVADQKKNEDDANADGDDEDSDNNELTINDVNFRRVVLDEAHVIRNGKKNLQSVLGLKATYRWALTGSPFVNKPKDVQSLLKFLGVAPLSENDVFEEHVQQKIEKGMRIGLTRLRAVLSHVALRRVKANVGFDSKQIQEKDVFVKPVSFGDDCPHGQIHDSFHSNAQSAIEGGTGTIFKDVLRVRQACTDASMIPYAERLEHGFGDDAAGEKLGISPKTQAILDLVETMEGDEKGVIFSEWTMYIDIIAAELAKHGHTFALLVGSMAPDQRAATMKLFADKSSDYSKENPRFLLCSLGAAGVGITLTRANVVIMTSPWWNDALERQAIDRVHRLGQERKVRAYRLVMKDSIEEGMLRIQEAKAAMGKGIVQRLKKKDLEKAKLTTLKDLFGIQDDSNFCWDMMDDLGDRLGGMEL